MCTNEYIRVENEYTDGARICVGLSDVERTLPYWTVLSTVFSMPAQLIGWFKTADTVPGSNYIVCTFSAALQYPCE